MNRKDFHFSLKFIWLWVKQSLLLLYAGIFLFMHFCVDLYTFKSRATVASLSRLMPSFDYILEAAEKNLPLDQERLREYEYYFEKVEEHIQERPDIYGMLGYFYYQTGKKRQAIRALKKAIDLNPYYFGFLYNLGVIYYRDGYYGEAIEYFKDARMTKISFNLNFVSNSKVYFPMIRDPAEFAHEVTMKLRQGMRNCYTFLILSCLALGDFDRIFAFGKEAIRFDFDDTGFFHYYTGRAAYELKKFKEASVYLQESIRINHNYPDSFYYLGLSLRELGNQNLSRKVLNQAEILRSSPDMITDFFQEDQMGLQLY